MHGIITSSHTCHFTLDIVDATIVRNDVFYQKAINYAIMAGAAALVQIALSKRQMEVRGDAEQVIRMARRGLHVHQHGRHVTSCHVCMMSGCHVMMLHL